MSGPQDALKARSSDPATSAAANSAGAADPPRNEGASSSEDRWDPAPPAARSIVAPAGANASWFRRHWEILATAALAIVVLVVPIANSGIWDPFELNVAELSRRLAIHLYHGGNLAIEGGENSMPKLGDLGKGELPFNSIAVGFRLFGLHEWAGRFPLALWGVAGVLALYWALSRLMDRRAGLYGAAALMTMPLYFLHARTMLGDIVTMSATTIAFAGLAVAVFDRRGGVNRGRVVALALALFGLAAGFLSRGLLLGVALPALSVGLAWGVTCGAAHREGERFSDIVGGALVVLGGAAAILGIHAAFENGTDHLRLAGATVATQSKFPTFDYVILYLGHSLLPWSAFIPFAVGRLFREPPSIGEGDEAAAARTRESHLRLAVLVGAAVAFGGYSIVAPRFGYLPFGAPALLAAIVAIAVRDYERGAPPSRALGVGVAVIAALYLRDYNMFPEKALSAFGVGATVPDSFKDFSGKLVLISTGVFALLVFFAWLERENRPYFKKDDYLTWPRTLAKEWNGHLATALLAFEAALIVLWAVSAAGFHLFHWKFITTQSVYIRVCEMNLFWIFPVALLLVVWAVMALRDVFRFVFDRTHVSRGLATMIAGLAVGSIFSFRYYPALAAQLSPKEIFEAYSRMHGPSEPLGLLGLTGRSATYYSGSEVKMFTDVQAAYGWLTGGTGRRWLAVRSEDLTRLNSIYRGRPGTPHTNVPVLDARSSQILLVSNELRPSEKNQSPFDSMLFGQPPSIQHPVVANLQDQLESLGWEVRDMSNALVDFLIPGKKYHFRLFYRVLGPISGEWETFIHIDGHHRRYNGDHKTLAGKYPFHLWQVGDFIVDDFEFSLEPNFTAGPYNVYYGLFVGETRMKVKSGAHDDNRIDGGSIRVQ